MSIADEARHHLWLAYTALSIALVRLPWWVLSSLPRARRPRPSWPLTRVIWLRLLQATANFGDNRPFAPNHTQITGGTRVKGVWVAPAPALVRGDVARWAAQAGVAPARIPGYWIDAPGADIAAGAPPRAGERVIFGLHGGAFTKLSAHPGNVTSGLRHGVLAHTTSVARVFNLEYRLAARRGGAHENPFPAAIVDAIAGYAYLVHTVGFKPEDIIFLGDSAGANLALALVRYLLERAAAGDTDLPRVPAALVLCSPWVDLEVKTHRAPAASARRNVGSDYIDLAGADFTAATDLFLGPWGRAAAVANRYVSPASDAPTMEAVSFKGFPRTYIVVGGAETLRDQAFVLKGKMAADVGEESVCITEFPDAIHDFCIFTFHEPERTDACRGMAAWIDAL